jgi:hypothetical protein
MSAGLFSLTRSRVEKIQAIGNKFKENQVHKFISLTGL